MDLYAKLSSNMEAIVDLFNSRMEQMERNIQEQQTSKPSQPNLETLTREFYDFKQLIWKSVAMLKNQMELMLISLDRHEMSSRRKVLLLHGIPENTDEDAKTLVTKVFTEQLKMTSDCITNISVVHRLGFGQTKARPILVRFMSYAIRSQVWKSKTLLKGTQVTMSEFLTKSRYDTFKAARAHFGIKNCWTSDGKIVILLSNKTRRKIEQMSEFRLLSTQYPTKEINTKAAAAPMKSARGALASTRRQVARRDM